MLLELSYKWQDYLSTHCGDEGDELTLAQRGYSLERSAS